jgi:hypothetical protein
MSVVLVRDDDANATTPPERLERTYAPLLDAGVPVSFAVIPAVALDTLAPDAQRERFIDPDAERTDRELALTSDAALARWLRAHEGQVGALVHGLSHRRRRGGTEMGSLGFDESAQLLEAGLAIMTEALHAAPIGFVPPWDVLSAGALRAVAACFDLVSMGWVDRARLPPSAWPAHALERLGGREALRVGRTWLLRHRGGLIRATTPPQQVGTILASLARGADVAVVVLHHWMFWSGPQPHPAIVALGRALRGHMPVSARQAVRYLDSLPRLRAPPLRPAVERVSARLRAYGG